MNTKSDSKYVKKVEEDEPSEIDSDEEPFIDQGAGIKYGVLTEANAIIALVLNIVMMPVGYIFGALTDERIRLNKVYFTMFIVGIVIWVIWLITMLLMGLCNDDVFFLENLKGAIKHPEMCVLYTTLYGYSEYILIVYWIAGLVYGYKQIQYSQSPKIREALGHD